MHSSFLRRAAGVAVLGLAAAVLASPAVAQAEETVPPAPETLTVDQYAADMTAVAAATKTAATPGWREHLVVNDYVVDIRRDTATKRTLSVGAFGREQFRSVVVDGKGIYSSLRRDKATLVTLKVLGKPGAQYVYTADTSIRQGPDLGPVTLADDVAALDGYGAPVTITRTVAGDGAAAYAVTGPDGSLKFAVSATHTLLSGQATSTYDGETDKVSFSVSYGAQAIPLPAASVTVTAEQLLRAEALQRRMDSVARRVTAKAKSAAKKHHGKVSTSDVRAAAKAAAREVRKSEAKMTVSYVKGGARITAVEPKTKARVTMVVKASRGKVSITR